MLIGKSRFKDLNEKEFGIALLTNITVFFFLGIYNFSLLFSTTKNFLDWMALEIAVYGVISFYIVVSDAYIKQQHIGSYQWFLSKLNIKASNRFSNKIIDCTILFLGLNYVILLYYILMAIVSHKLELQILFVGAFVLNNTIMIICFKEYLDGKIITEKEILLIDEVDIFSAEEKQDFKNKLSEIIEKNHMITRSDVQIVFEKMQRNNIENQNKENAFQNYKQILNKKESLK